MEIVMRSKKGQELVTRHFSGCQIFSEVFYFMIYHLTTFDAFIQRGFGVFQKIIIGNLFKPFHYVILIPFPAFS